MRDLWERREPRRFSHAPRSTKGEIIMAKPLLSIGIIFKNEIRCLERCLKSLQPLREAIPCELVMADTGADDGSREVAEKYADILIDFPWINDFSAARNATMERCSGKWYMFIDCDEWLAEDISGLIRFVTEEESYIYGAVTIRNYHTLELDKDDDYADFTACRLLRMSSGLRFVGAIHEHWPAYNGEQHILQAEGVLFHHDGYLYLDPVVTKKKHARNMALLLERLKENPEDLAVLMQCIESGDDHPDFQDFIRRGVAGVEAHHPGWKILGASILRYAVVAAFKSGNYETVDEDIARAERMFPDSMYTRLDVQFVAFGWSWSNDDYPDCIRRGERYLNAHRDFEAGNYDPMDIVSSTLSTSSNSFKMQLMIFLSAAYLYEKQPEKCLAMVSQLDGSRMSLKHTGDIVRTCAHLHARSRLDTASIIQNLWEQINRPTPSEDRARQRSSEFIRLASELFLPAYRDDESGREDFCRHSYTLFLPLEGKCVLGDAAAILMTEDVPLLEEKLTRLEDFERIPIHALYHALERGASFPPIGRTLNLEQMDMLAGRLAQDKEQLHHLAVQAADRVGSQNWRELSWSRSLALAAVQNCDWSDAAQKEQNLSIIRSFARVEKRFLPCCYAPEALTEERLALLPPMHRFGWYCAQAFDALNAGDTAGYVRLLREGLAACEGVKDLVEFLLDNTPELKNPSDELKAMAEQVRGILSKFAPDDPSITVLKQSEAYQKVAYLIEGMEPPITGGLVQ